MKLHSLLLGLVLVVCSTSAMAVEHDIPNFKPVPDAPGVYRGGQPKSQAGWVYLHSLGVSNVIKLNPQSESSDKAARALGMTVNYFPINKSHQLLFKPNLQSVSNAVAAIKPGTYIHCEHGQDRTGLVVGCKRVWQDGWGKTNAWNEMIADGFHPALHGLTDFWKDEVH